MTDPQIWVPVALAVSSGLAFLAYKHSDFYVNVSQWIMRGCLVVMVAVSIWDVAVIETGNAMADVVTTDIGKVRAVQSEMQVGFFRTLAAVALTIVFLKFLETIPTDGPPKKRGATEADDSISS
jgi:hypothetical protein